MFFSSEESAASTPRSTGSADDESMFSSSEEDGAGAPDDESRSIKEEPLLDSVYPEPAEGLEENELRLPRSFGTIPPMGEDTVERRANSGMKIAFRVLINIAVVLFLQNYFDSFFDLRGGYQGIAIVSLAFTVLNMLIVPVLHVLSLPIKMIAWVVAFIIVNAAAVWLTVWFITALNIPGVSLSIEGGVVGWIFVSVIFGMGNWVVKAIVK